MAARVLLSVASFGAAAAYRGSRWSSQKIQDGCDAAHKCCANSAARGATDPARLACVETAGILRWWQWAPASKGDCAKFVHADGVWTESIRCDRGVRTWRREGAGFIPSTTDMQRQRMDSEDGVGELGNSPKDVNSQRIASEDLRDKQAKLNGALDLDKSQSQPRESEARTRELTALQAQRNVSEGEIRSLRRRIEDLSSQILASETERNALHAIVPELESNQAKLSGALNKSQSQCMESDARAKELTAKYEYARRQVKDLQAERKVSEEVISDLRHRIEYLSSQIIASKENNVALSVILQERQSNQAKLSGAFGKSTRQLRQSEAKAKELTAKYKDARRQVEDLQAERKVSEEVISDLRHLIGELNSQIRVSETKRNALHAIVTDLETKLAELSGAFDNSKIQTRKSEARDSTSTEKFEHARLEPFFADSNIAIIDMGEENNFLNVIAPEPESKQAELSRARDKSKSQTRMPEVSAKELTAQSEHALLKPFIEDSNSFNFAMEGENYAFNAIAQDLDSKQTELRGALGKSQSQLRESERQDIPMSHIQNPQRLRLDSSTLRIDSGDLKDQVTSLWSQDPQHHGQLNSRTSLDSPSHLGGPLMQYVPAGTKGDDVLRLKTENEILQNQLEAWQGAFHESQRDASSKLQQALEVSEQMVKYLQSRLFEQLAPRRRDEFDKESSQRLVLERARLLKEVTPSA